MGNTTVSSRDFGSSPSPTPLSWATFALRPFGADSLAIKLLPAADDRANEAELAQSFRDLLCELERTPRIRSLILDCENVSSIPDEARGGVISLCLLFRKRDGLTFCQLPDTTMQAFTCMKLNKIFSTAERCSGALPTEALVKDCRDMVERIGERRFEEACLQRSRDSQLKAPPAVLCNGNLVFYSIHEETVTVSLNPEILSLEEDISIGQRLREVISNIAEAEPNAQRIVLSLRGLEFMGADPLGALISLHNAGKSGASARLALCSLEPTVAEKFQLTRMNRFFTIFPDPESALVAAW
ncbi:MAG: STAS domain-containing protein [Deltaproteobacteria bacterium]|nr:STAS domain-containing protein [Deltaproteobacteria bacterium]